MTETVKLKPKQNREVRVSVHNTKESRNWSCCRPWKKPVKNSSQQILDFFMRTARPQRRPVDESPQIFLDVRRFSFLLLFISRVNYWPPLVGSVWEKMREFFSPNICAKCKYLHCVTAVVMLILSFLAAISKLFITFPSLFSVTGQHRTLMIFACGSSSIRFQNNFFSSWILESIQFHRRSRKYVEKRPVPHKLVVVKAGENFKLCCREIVEELSRKRSQTEPRGWRFIMARSELAFSPQCRRPCPWSSFNPGVSPNHFVNLFWTFFSNEKLKTDIKQHSNVSVNLKFGGAPEPEIEIL